MYLEPESGEQFFDGSRSGSLCRTLGGLAAARGVSGAALRRRVRRRRQDGADAGRALRRDGTAARADRRHPRTAAVRLLKDTTKSTMENISRFRAVLSAESDFRQNHENQALHRNSLFVSRYEARGPFH